MAHLVKYACIGGESLDKAQCDICKDTYDSLEKAKDCEKSHITNIFNDLLKGIGEIKLN